MFKINTFLSLNYREDWESFSYFHMLRYACFTVGDMNNIFFLGQYEQKANVRAIPCQGFQSN